MNKIKVVCVECGKTFSTASMVPTCPRCKGSDIELAGYYDEGTNSSNGWRAPEPRKG